MASEVRHRLCSAISPRSPEEPGLDGLAFEAQLAPFVDEAAGFLDAATGRQDKLVVIPPDAADGDDSLEATAVPDAERGSEFGWASESGPPL